MDVFSLFHKGCIISPFYSDDEINSLDDYQIIDFTKEVGHKFFVSPTKINYNSYYDKKKVIFFKITKPYHITPQDLIEKFRNDLNQEFGPCPEELSHFLSILFLISNRDFMFEPISKYNYLEECSGIYDYTFESDDYLVIYVLTLLKQDLYCDALSEKLKSYIDFIEEILSKRKTPIEEREYSVSTLSLLLSFLSENSLKRIPLTIDATDFYRKNVVKNAKEGDAESIRMLGYDYYNGTHDFEIDFEKAHYWLKKHYEKTQDPFTANSLGYIYYYGRVNGGVPEKEKAFQYFSIGYIGGGCFESSYKLADCYVHGYGTPINHQCAYHLVSDVYNATKHHFLNDRDSKFADAALRLGTYAKDGIHRCKNLLDALNYFLEARFAIRTRIKNQRDYSDEYIAFKIQKTIDEIEEKIKPKTRIIKEKGFLLENPKVGYFDLKYKTALKDDYIYLAIMPSNRSNEEYLINTFLDISFCERSKKVEYYLKPRDLESSYDLVNSLNIYKIKEVIIEDSKLIFTLKDKRGRISTSIIMCDEIYFKPQTFKKLNRSFVVATVKNLNNSHIDHYLCSKNHIPSVGDVLPIKYYSNITKGEIIDIHTYFEDQLCIPLNNYKRFNID